MNYKINKIKDTSNTKFGIKTMIYNLDIKNGLIFPNDYYGIINDIIKLSQKSVSKDSKIRLSINDENHPRICRYIFTKLLDINSVNPDNLFDIIEYNSEDDDNFDLSGSTEIMVELFDPN